jgi:hypothetical protein
VSGAGCRPFVAALGCAGTGPSAAPVSHVRIVASLQDFYLDLISRRSIASLKSFRPGTLWHVAVQQAEIGEIKLGEIVGFIDRL